MKALSLWQPWASAVALDAKRIETRHWWTGYRGPLAIHAAKHKPILELTDLHCERMWCSILSPLWSRERLARPDIDALPFGAIVAVCELADVVETRRFDPAALRAPIRRLPSARDEWGEAEVGDFSLGRFGWVLTNVQPLAQPLPWAGRQGLFDIPDDILRAALAQPEPCA